MITLLERLKRNYIDKRFQTEEFKAYAIHPLKESFRIALFFGLFGVFWISLSEKKTMNFNSIHWHIMTR